MTASASYPLAPAAPALPASSSGAAQEVVPNAAPRTVVRGLLLPFQRNGRDDFVNGTGRDVHIARVELFLSTRGPSERGPGELPYRPDAGAPLHLLRHKNNNLMLREMARHWIADGFRKSLPGYRLTDVGMPIRRKNELLLPITFDVVKGNVPVERGLTAEVTIEKTPE